MRFNRLWFASAVFLIACVISAFAQQTVPDTVVGGVYNTGTLSLHNYQRSAIQVDSAGNLKTVPGTGVVADVNILQLGSSAVGALLPVLVGPTSLPGDGIVPTATQTATTTLVLKTSAGNLYSIRAVNQSSTAALLQIYDATTTPADGTVKPAECISVAGNGSAVIDHNPGPPAVFALGIVASFSQTTTCFTKTTGGITGFISGFVQ